MADFNSQWTGAQIDAAIGAVKEKETTWDDKQDAISSPADIGAAAKDHTQAASTITAGTLAGQVKANATAATALTTAQVRNIYAGTSDMTAGTTALTTGDIYFVYE